MNRRVKVTSPQTRIALARRHRPDHHLLPLPEPTDVRAARALLSAQRRVATITVSLLATVLFGLSGVIAVFPILDQWRIGPFPVSWLLLGVAAYPALLGIAIWHVRSAERAEDRR